MDGLQRLQPKVKHPLYFSITWSIYNFRMPCKLIFKSQGLVVIRKGGKKARVHRVVFPVIHHARITAVLQ